MPQVSAVGMKDPDSAQYFSDADPEQLYKDLREIGHGSFGAVYYAKDATTKEVVAIKKMSYGGKKSVEKWQDIVREVKILCKLKHRYTIEYKGCYLTDHTAWLVMEYCLGSASDIIEVHKSPLKEEEIAAICRDSLEGLEYLHSMNYIHRDVKAGNILLTDSGLVKLADFGSASISCPANSFVGTPYWMSPEVILAMDDGQYTGNSDIWSLGITCIELAEGKPPLFNMNAMAALYHIPQNDPPTLASANWTQHFKNFVDACLQKDPLVRPDATQQLKNIFITKYADQSRDIILDLIKRTKAAVREMDKRSARKIKFIMEDYHSNSSLNESNGSLPIQEDQLLVDDSSQDEISIGEGSTTNSVGSHGTDESTDVVAGGSSNDIISIRNPYPPELRRNSGGSDTSAQINANNFATIRTPSIVKKQKVEHQQDDLFKEQMSGYKRMRRQHQKHLQQLEDKFKMELDLHKAKQAKEYELLMVGFCKELEKLKKIQQQQQEKSSQQAQADEDHMEKNLKKQQRVEMEKFTKELAKQKKLRNEEMKRSVSLTPKKEKDESLKNFKLDLEQEQVEAKKSKDTDHKHYMNIQIRRFKRQKLVGFHQMEQRWLREELNLKELQNSTQHSMLLRHHEQTQEMEYKHQAAIHKLRDEQLRKQHNTELQNQHEYTERQEKELAKRHALQAKQLPRSLHESRQKLKKQLREALQTQDKQYKARKDAEIAKAPRSEHRTLIKSLKEEQDYKSRELYNQYQLLIENMIAEQNVTLDENQLAETQELKRKLQQETELLMAYQSKIRMQMDGLHNREKKELQERVSLRRAELEQKIENECQQFNLTRASSQRKQHETQARDIELFDRETQEMGIEPMEILIADDDFKRILEEDHSSDTGSNTSSVTSSLASLTISNSSVSFSTQL